MSTRDILTHTMALSQAFVDIKPVPAWRIEQASHPTKATKKRAKVKAARKQRNRK